MQHRLQKITTIIPTYKRPAFLKRAIKSVLNQTYLFVEVCVYDNASNDETYDIVMELAKKDPRIKYHAHRENIGSGPNFQYGLSKVETSFFSFLSDDDVLLPWFYEKAIKAFQSHPEVGFFAGSLLYVNENKKIVKLGMAAEEKEVYLDSSTLIEKMLQGSFPLWTSIVFHKKVKEQLGGLDLEVGPFDSDFLLRAAVHFSAIASNEVCALFLRHEFSFSEAPDLKFVWPGWEKMIQTFVQEKKISNSVRTQGEKLMHQDVKKMLYRVLVVSLMKKDFKTTRDAAELLENLYGNWIFKWSALIVIKFCGKFDFFHRGFNFFCCFLFGMRNLLNQLKSQKKYGNFPLYLE